jgi:hypothetical protein
LSFREGGMQPDLLIYASLGQDSEHDCHWAGAIGSKMYSDASLTIPEALSFQDGEKGGGASLFDSDKLPRYNRPVDHTLLSGEKGSLTWTLFPW